MNFLEAIQSGFRNYFTFGTRAIRSEFWYWVLFTVIGIIVVTLADGAVFGFDDTLEGGSLMRFTTLFDLATFIPSIAISIRRLHDIDRTGWWFLIAFTVIGLFVLIYWNCQRGTVGPNRFGPDPLGGAISPH